MENASKALFIAAGILIGMLIMSLFVYEMAYISGMGTEYQTQMDFHIITEFNTQFVKYVGQSLTAQDVITIYNYCTEWNFNNPTYPVEITTNIQDLKQVINGYMDIEEFLDKYWDSDTKVFALVLNDNSYDDLGRIINITITTKNI